MSPVKPLIRGGPIGIDPGTTTPFRRSRNVVRRCDRQAEMWHAIRDACSVFGLRRCSFGISERQRHGLGFTLAQDVHLD